MNFVGRSYPSARRAPGHRRCAFYVVPFFLALCAAGCADNVQTPTPEELTAFEQAGPAQPTVDVDVLRRAKLQTGPYRVVPGDVLEFTMPSLLQAVTTGQAQAAQAQTKDDRPYICRVSPRGTVTLPAVGEIDVAGGTLAEIEEKVIDSYRRYVVLRPSVFVRVLEYKTHQTSIIGAVAKPGIYMLRGDQMSLVALLMEAGGIVEQGAAVIKISRLNSPDASASGERASLGLQRPTRAASAYQTVRLSMRQPEPTAPPIGIAHADGAAQATFQPEGPLCTTGWLTLERGGEVLARRWLDIGSASQKQMLAGAVTGQSDSMALEDLQTRLSYLAKYLDLRCRDRQTVSTLPAPGWEAMPDDQFVARLGSMAADTERDDDSPGKVITEATVATSQDAVTTLVLPVRGLNIPFHDVGLVDGDTVVVERIQEPLFSVLGLVARPGNFPYPPNVEYNVTQAIAFAGGLDPVADPRYVTIYRLAKDGSIVRIPLKLIEGGKFTDVLSTQIKPGDVVAIEHTPRTRANMLIHNLLRVNTGLYVTGRDLWGGNY